MRAYIALYHHIWVRATTQSRLISHL